MDKFNCHANQRTEERRNESQNLIKVLEDTLTDVNSIKSEALNVKQDSVNVGLYNWLSDNIQDGDRTLTILDDTRKAELQELCQQISPDLISTAIFKFRHRTSEIVWIENDKSTELIIAEFRRILNEIIENPSASRQTVYIQEKIGEIVP